MLTDIISQFQNRPNFAYKVFTKHHEQFYSLPAHDTTQLLINYTEAECYHSHFYWFDSIDPDVPKFSTDLTYEINSPETGQIYGLFYGFNNPDFYGFLDSLIEAGVKFNVVNVKFGGQPTELGRGKYRQLKSGKWRKRKDS